MKHYVITVSGKVQGVFYRQSTIETARQLGVKGYVKNETNGNVYIEAEGTTEQLKGFIDWCKKGPTRAIVSDVMVEEGEIKNYSSFEIRR